MKQKHVTLLAASALIILSMQGCAVNKQLTPTGGSRADGTVKLSFEYGAFEVPKLDGQQGMSAARQRCAEWGYTVHGHAPCIEIVSTKMADQTRISEKSALARRRIRFTKTF